MPQTWTYNTAAVLDIKSGTNWNINVTNANLDPDTSIQDFVVLFNGVIQTNTDFIKTTSTNLMYLGAPIAATTVEVRRRTPSGAAKIVKYGERFSSDDWNREINRINRRAAEWEAFGITSGGVLPNPKDDPYGALWSNDTIYPATRKRIYDKIESVISGYQSADMTIVSGYQSADASLQTQINSLSGGAAPRDDVYGTVWSTDTTFSATRKRIYDKIESVVAGYGSADAGLQTQINNNATAIAARAPLASPALTGTPTAPSPATNLNNGQIQTTEGVRNFLSSATDPKTINNAAINSATLTNTTITAVTQPKTTNNTTLATTAFGHIASVTKKITNQRSAAQVSVTANTYTSVVTLSVTPRSANSSFLVFLYSFYTTNNANSVAQVQLRCSSSVIASNRLWPGGGDLELGSLTMMGLYTPGSASTFTVTVEARNETAGAQWDFGHPVSSIDNQVGSFPQVFVLEFENTI